MAKQAANNSSGQTTPTPAELFDYSGRSVLVTGGSRGIGRNMALGFAAAGAQVVVSSRKADACAAVVREIEAAGGRALAIPADACIPEQLEQLAEAAWGRCGRIDVLVNNAGIGLGAPMECADLGLWEKIIGVNLRGPWYLSAQLAPKMRDAGGGAIINVISVGGLRPGSGVGIYCAAKAGLAALTQSMAAEWAPWRLRVNALAPGPYDTDMLRKAEQAMPGFMEASAQSTAMRRVAEGREIIGAALFLGSDAAAGYTTGSVVVSDGGFMVQAPATAD